MNKKHLAIIAVLILALVAVLLIYNYGQKINTSSQSPVNDITDEQAPKEEGLTFYGLTDENRNAVSAYLNNNISSLSPEEPVLGGSWYITAIEFTDFNRADVRFEDGHISRRAMVSFAFSENGELVINDFLIIPDEESVFNEGTDVDNINPRILTDDSASNPQGTVGIPESEPVFCTMDAMICPDGSSVGRIGPNCDFAPCPDSN